MKRVSVVAAVLVGINAILSQVILIRELLVNFSGNELSMGIILALWLTGGAAGSLLIARIFIDRIKNPADTFAVTLSFISVIIPSIVFLSRTAKILFKIPIYETIGPLSIVSICGLLLLPLSCLLSISFVLAAKMLKEAAPETNAPAIVYILEALGATLAGAVFTFFLAGRFSSFQTALGLLTLNFLYLLWLSLITKKRVLLTGLLLLIASSAFLFNFAATLDKKSQDLQWYPQKVLAYRDSPYGNISVTGVGEAINFYENGSLFFTTHDQAFNEEFAHLVMLQHPDPKRVLLLGGGIGGILKELLKYEPRRITYLELDPLTIELGREFISEDNRTALTDSRVQIVNQDGRFFLKRAKEKFDLIAVNLPDPTTLQLNRFYTREFYNEARGCLNEGGIVAVRLSSKEVIISDELARYNSSVYKSLKSAFSFVGPIPGEGLIFIASEDPQILKDRPQVLIKRFEDKKIKTRFLTTYHIRDRYYPANLTYLKQRLLSQEGEARINTDFHPVCFYYDLILWGVMFHPGLVGFFNLVVKTGIYPILGLILLLFVSGLFIIKIRKDRIRYILPSAIAAGGSIGIALEIILILSFQINYGYVYEKVGLLIALFMLGIASGGYIINKKLDSFKDHLKLLSGIIVFYALYMLSVPFIVRAAASFSTGAAGFIYYLMMLGAGAAIGAQFPPAVAILQKESSAANSAAIIWGADLLGATAGTLISSLVIIPVLGIFKTALLGSLLGGLAAILLILSRPVRNFI